MAEFDSTAFSAVDSFFVIDRKPDDDKNDHSSAKTAQPASGKARRLGVGASATKQEPPVATAAASKLLDVGKKKRSRVEDNEIEEDEANYDDGDDEEEEIGRTGIASEPPKSETPTENAPASKKKKRKRKRGKKERQVEKNDVQKGLMDEADENNATEKQDDPADVSKGSEAEKQHDSEENETNKPKRKRKRRKVRSRQKNIYKDNRLLDEKPDHLVPGGYDYKGRPITPATKTKLASKNILPDDSMPRTSNDDAVEDMGAPMDDNQGTKKAITNKQPNKTRRGNPKYKNLQ